MTTQLCNVMTPGDAEGAKYNTHYTALSTRELVKLSCIMMKWCKGPGVACGIIAGGAHFTDKL